LAELKKTEESFMKSLLLIACALMIGNASFAKTTKPKTTATTEAKENFKLIHSKDVEGWIKTDSKSVFVFDANNEKTRKEFGAVPQATLLNSSSNYDVAKTLPTDKNAKLVFYCANEMCMASHDAAKRAASAGYTNVNVMADGIQGWAKNGFATKKM
jgi:rhodanese-related sulfurtransferase